MKKNLYVAVAALVMVMAMVCGAYANDSKTLDISVNVGNTCTAITNGTAVTLALDPLNHPDVTNGAVLSVAPSIYCTNQSSHAVTCTPTHNNLSVGNNGTSDPIPYTINGCTSPITGNGFGTPTTIPFGINVLGANYQNAQAGVHTDTVTITVTY